MGQKKKVKLEDIAQRLDVSIVTVSNALKGKKGVSDEMRDKIVQTAQEMGYQNTAREKKTAALISSVLPSQRNMSRSFHRFTWIFTRESRRRR